MSGYDSLLSGAIRSTTGWLLQHEECARTHAVKVSLLVHRAKAESFPQQCISQNSFVGIRISGKKISPVLPLKRSSSTTTSISFLVCGAGQCSTGMA